MHLGKPDSKKGSLKLSNIQLNHKSFLKQIISQAIKYLRYLFKAKYSWYFLSPQWDF